MAASARNPKALKAFVEATSEALFKVVAADEPPLRLVLGSRSLPIFRQIYADRLDMWEKWEAVSNAAQGANYFAKWHSNHLTSQVSDE